MNKIILCVIVFIIMFTAGCEQPAVVPTESSSPQIASSTTTTPPVTSPPTRPPTTVPATQKPHQPPATVDNTSTQPPSPIITYGEYTVYRAEITGPEIIVFDWSEDRCDFEDLPDAPARAFRDADGKVHLIASHYVGREMIGDTLDTVHHDCSVIMDSDKDVDPGQYNDYEWLMSFYTLDGVTIHGLVHNEYQGHMHTGKWPPCFGNYLPCLYTSVTYACSVDKGASYTHPQSPNHLVACLPYLYEPNIGPYGIASPSNIVYNPEDGYYYTMIHIMPAGDPIGYSSAMRTKTLDDPRSWRAWDGSGFNIGFINPYIDNPIDPTAYLPKPISFTYQENVGSNSLTHNDYFDKYISVGVALDYDPRKKEFFTGIFFSLSDDLVHWSGCHFIMEAPASWPEWESDEWISYPSLLDPDDTSRNFEITGREPYMYYTRKNPTTPQTSHYDRDLARIPLRFTKETLPTAWEFDEPGNDEGWYPEWELTPFIIEDGLLKTSSTDSSFYTQFEHILNLDASIYDTIEIRMKVNDGLWGTIYFTTTDDETWDEQKSVQFNISPGDDFVTYYLDMKTVETWAGHISKIRLAPAFVFEDVGVDIEIDYIRIYTID